ncbi:MAG: hypothetical protein ABSG91_06750 [Syntrophobacteraceae bacterium]
MRLLLHELCSMHPPLRGHPTDLSKCGGLALQRAGHTSPVLAGIDHDGLEAIAEIEWLSQGLTILEVLDSNRVTEDGAEAVALSYANSKAGWIVKRRLQRGESADWLLFNEVGWLALEVSGMISGDPLTRLKEKQQQVARCSLPTDRLAVVVAFDRPLIMASSP